MSNGNKSTVHHLIPRSRGGDSSKANLKRLPWRIHDAWHILFFNLLPEEICAQILIVPDCLFDTANKRLAWSVVFHQQWQDVQSGLVQEDIVDQVISGWLPSNYTISWEKINHIIWQDCCGNCSRISCCLARLNQQQWPFEKEQAFYYCDLPIKKALVARFI